MTHNPEPTVLDRAASEREIRSLASVACPLLDELTNVGTIVWGHCQDSDSADQEPTFPILASFLHMLEMNDAVSELLRHSCSWASVPACRSLFEALLSIEFIAERDSNDRAAAWWVAYLHSARRTIEMGDHRTAAGQEFLATVQKDKTLGGWGEVSEAVMDRFYESTQGMLAHPRYRAASDEYQAVKKRLHRRPNWYTLFGGPQDIRALAYRLERGAQYELLYRQWSDVVHPMNLTRWVRPNSGFPPASVPLRDPKVAAHLAFCAANFVAEGVAALGAHFELSESQFLLLGEDARLQLEMLRQWDSPTTPPAATPGPGG